MAASSWPAAVPKAARSFPLKLRLSPLLTLTKAAEFQEVRKSGKSWHTPHFILSWLRREDGLRRIGFIVTKKTAADAVDRNRIRRRLRPLLREILPQQAQPGDYVVIGRAACLDADAETLKKDLLWALRNLSQPSS